MKTSTTSLRRRVAALTVCSAIAATAALGPSTARAHFVLQEPPASTEQDALGSPQKAPPCGDGTDNGVVTAYAEGQTITITINETIPHPGHYRVALGVNGPDDLPDEPPVTPGSTDCGSTVIQDPPVFPVLADGELLHTSALDGPQSFQVTLPAGVKCESCTLQVIEFMSNHALNVPGGCFYHHCATVSIGTSEPTSVTTTGATSSTGAGGNGAGGESGGCAVASGDASTSAALAALAALVAVVGAALAARRKRG